MVDNVAFTIGVFQIRATHELIKEANDVDIQNFKPATNTKSMHLKTQVRWISIGQTPHEMKCMCVCLLN